MDLWWSFTFFVCVPEYSIDRQGEAPVRNLTCCLEMFIVPADDVGTDAAAATTPSIVREVPRMILLCTVRLVSHGITGGLDYCSWTLDGNFETTGL